MNSVNKALIDNKRNYCRLDIMFHWDKAKLFSKTSNRIIETIVGHIGRSLKHGI